MIIIFTLIHQGHLHINSYSVSSYLLTSVAITTITMAVNLQNYPNLELSYSSIIVSEVVVISITIVTLLIQLNFHTVQYIPLMELL